jgi:hypothetical protein
MKFALRQTRFVVASILDPKKKKYVMKIHAASAPIKKTHHLMDIMIQSKIKWFHHQ